MTDDQPNYLCNDDDLNSLTDYFNAALAGEESKSRLKQLWEQVIGIVKATRQDKKKQSMSDRYKDEEPDLTPISNCIKKEPIVITPKICTLFWNYRADSGHLYHLLFDLVGEEFVTSHELMDSIMKVLDEWQTPEEKQKHDTAIRNAVLDELGILHGEDAKRFNEQLNHPEPLTPEARDLVARAKEIAKRERMALDDRDRLIREDERRIGRIVLEKADKAIERQKRSNIGASIAWFKGMSLAQDILASLYTNGDEPE